MPRENLFAGLCVFLEAAKMQVLPRGFYHPYSKDHTLVLPSFPACLPKHSGSPSVGLPYRLFIAVCLKRPELTWRISTSTAGLIHEFDGLGVEVVRSCFWALSVPSSPQAIYTVPATVLGCYRCLWRCYRSLKTKEEYYRVKGLNEEEVPSASA